MTIRTICVERQIRCERSYIDFYRSLCLTILKLKYWCLELFGNSDKGDMYRSERIYCYSMKEKKKKTTLEVIEKEVEVIVKYWKVTLLSSSVFPVDRV